MSTGYAIVDLFAGPGGLAEGFSSFKTASGDHPFSVKLSVEKEKSAHRTLLFRSFLRQFGGTFPAKYYDWLNGGGTEPDWQALHPQEWQAAEKEALCLTLGEDCTSRIITKRISEIRAAHGRNTVLIGGPPCQAYSLVGRARNRGIADYDAAQDHRHFLYREYIGIISQLEPAAFVMENVKGMLSSTVDGVRMFDLITSDLRAPPGTAGYELYAFAPKGGESPAKGRQPSDFVVRAEDLGVPQARHRVIIIGLRRDVADAIAVSGRKPARQGYPRACVADVLDGMPRLRSGLSRQKDDGPSWALALEAACAEVATQVSGLPADKAAAIRRIIGTVQAGARSSAILPRQVGTPNGLGNACPPVLADWLRDDRLHHLPNNETRGHMPADLSRYLFASAYAAIAGHSPKASSFPAGLAPDHRNWDSGKFADRFRVQLRGQPSTTVTSHISKDGHYFIHPDPAQCRSLTVREAARLQTFPDNYLFRGNRTEQFVQVGNAVPPFLACQIAAVLWTILEDSGAERRVAVAQRAILKEVV